MKFETKNFTCQIKADVEQGIITGYGAYFNNMDSHRDIIQKGAFKKTIDENKARLVLLWQHDMYEPIGKFLNIYEDEKGLFIEAKISKTDIGQKALTLIRDGVIKEMSIGYMPVVDEYNKEEDIRYLKEVKLYEISLVTYASNEQAQITGLKNQEEPSEDTLTDEDIKCIIQKLQNKEE